MIIRSRAIVLRVRKYSDEAQIADVFTEELGRQSFFVRISRSRRAAVRHTLFQPLALLELEWNHREEQSLQRPRAARCTTPFATLPYDPAKAAIGLFVAEFLGYALREDQNPHTLYAFVSHSLEWLDTCRASFANFHLVFLLQLSRYLGFYPNLDLPAGRTLYFDLINSQFTSIRPDHSHSLAPDDARWLPLLMRLRYDTMHCLRLSGTMRSRLLGFVSEYYALHLPGFPEMKSMDVMRELFR